jgi:DUF971 family protein
VKPTKIKKTPNHSLLFTWEDHHTAEFPLKLLRDECPCAGCKGETLLLGKHMAPARLPILQPGMYELRRLEPVGNYALQAAWGDGHDTGIYTWEYLLELEKQIPAPSAGEKGGA